MLRYNRQYQRLADDYAIKHGEGAWIGAKYLGHYHEFRLDGIGPDWLAFEPQREDMDGIYDGLFSYIFINEEELVFFADLRVVTKYNIYFEGALQLERIKINMPKPAKSRPSKKDNFIVAITAQKV